MLWPLVLRSGNVFDVAVGVAAVLAVAVSFAAGDFGGGSRRLVPVAQSMASSPLPAAVLGRWGRLATSRSGGAGRVVEQRSSQRPRRLPQQESTEQPEQQPGFSVGGFVPDLCPPSMAGTASPRGTGLAGAAGRGRLRQVRLRFRGCPPTTVCGPRRRSEMAQARPVRTSTAPRRRR